MPRIPRLTVELTWFIIVGCVQLLVDWSFFVVLTTFHIPIEIANFGSRALGAFAGYYLNARLTFAVRSREVRVSGSTYRFLLTWLALTIVSTVALEGAVSLFGTSKAWIAKLIIEGVLAMLSFIVAKIWIFRKLENAGP